MDRRRPGRAGRPTGAPGITGAGRGNGRGGHRAGWRGAAPAAGARRARARRPVRRRAPAGDQQAGRRRGAPHLQARVEDGAERGAVAAAGPPGGAPRRADAARQGHLGPGAGGAVAGRTRHRAAGRARGPRAQRISGRRAGRPVAGGGIDPESAGARPGRSAPGRGARRRRAQRNPLRRAVERRRPFGRGLRAGHRPHAPDSRAPGGIGLADRGRSDLRDAQRRHRQAGAACMAPAAAASGHEDTAAHRSAGTGGSSGAGRVSARRQPEPGS